jgi:hypothetical protein
MRQIQTKLRCGLTLTLMSDLSPSPPGSPNRSDTFTHSHACDVTVQYTFIPTPGHTSTSSTKKKSKSTKTPKKETKSKMFDYTFKPTDSSYASLLKNLLKECSAANMMLSTRNSLGSSVAPRKRSCCHLLSQYHLTFLLL